MAALATPHAGVPRRLMAGLALASCACGGAPLARPLAPLPPPRAATVEEVKAAFDEHCRGLESLSAQGDLEVRDARSGKAQRIGVRLVAARGGRLYLKGSVAVVTALEVVANGERFWLQVPSKKTVWTGISSAAPARDAESAEQAPYYALRPADVTRALLPEPLGEEGGDLVLLEAERQSFSLLVGRGAGPGPARRRVWLDRESLRPLRLREFDERGDVSAEVTYSDYRDGFPREVVISRPAEGYVAAFSLDRAEPNAKVPERAFVPRSPEGYKVIEVQ